MRLSDLHRPFICTSLTDRTLEGTVRTLKQAEYAGASAFEVHLPLLDFPDRETLEVLADATAFPTYATCRRGRFYELLGVERGVDLTDDERTDLLLDAVRAGFDAVDVELDTFDPTPGPAELTREAMVAYADDPTTGPAEVTDDEVAVRRQREFVADVATSGGEVVLSAHTSTHLAPEDAVGIAERMTDRGADLCKIVGIDRTVDEALDTLRAHLRLNEADTAPYALMAIGDPSRIVRPIAPMFGSAWVFAQPELTPGGFHSWPLVENAREVLRRVDWRTAYDPHALD